MVIPGAVDENRDLGRLRSEILPFDSERNSTMFSIENMDCERMAEGVIASITWQQELVDVDVTVQRIGEAADRTD